MALSAFASVVTVLALVAPQFSQHATQQLQTDYPSWALREGLSTAVVFSAFVDPEGRVIRCDVASLMGSERLANYFCDRVERTRLKPAVDSMGAPVHGKIFTMTKMALPDTELGRKVFFAEKKPDLELTVEELPPEMGGSKQLKILIQVSQGGEVTACEGQNAEDAAYASAACTTLKQEIMETEKNKEGLPVPYVQELTVSFMEGAPS